MRSGENWALVALVTILVASLFFVVHPWYETVRDSSIYIRTSYSLLNGDGYSYLGVPFITRPPGFSVILMPVLQIWGTNFLALNLFVNLFGLLGVVLLFIYFKPRLGWHLASLVALAVWFNPGYRWLSNQVMSDVPGTSMLLACLLLESWCSRSLSWKRELLLGVLIGFSAYVRSMNLLLVPAIIASRCITRCRDEEGLRWFSFFVHRLFIFAITALLLPFVWSLRNQRVAPPAPVDQVGVYSYSTGMWHVSEDDPGSPYVRWEDILARVPIRLRQSIDVLGSRMGLRTRGRLMPSEPIRAAHVAFSTLLVAGLVFSAAYNRDPSAIFALGALVVVLVYFGFISRLLLPVFVLGIPAICGLFLYILKRIYSALVAEIILAIGLACLILVDFHPRKDWNKVRERHVELEERVRSVAPFLEPTSRLGSAMGFYYSVFLDRPVYSLWIAIRRTGEIGESEFIIDKYDIDTLILSEDDHYERQILNYVRVRYKEIKRIRSTFIVNLDSLISRDSGEIDRIEETPEHDLSTNR